MRWGGQLKSINHVRITGQEIWGGGCHWRNRHTSGEEQPQSDTQEVRFILQEMKNQYKRILDNYFIFIRP